MGSSSSSSSTELLMVAHPSLSTPTMWSKREEMDVLHEHDQPPATSLGGPAQQDPGPGFLVVQLGAPIVRLRISTLPIGYAN